MSKQSQTRARWLGGLLLALSCSCGAATPAPHVMARIGDPFQQCEAVAKALPDTLAKLRAKGKVLSEKPSRDTAEYCDATQRRCRRVALRMVGLYVDLLDAGSKLGLSPLVVEISSSRWPLMKGLNVGQPVSEALALYGAEEPVNDGRFAICGEAVCLELEHRDQRVTRVRLDCQAAT